MTTLTCLIEPISADTGACAAQELVSKQQELDAALQQLGQMMQSVLQEYNTKMQLLSLGNQDARVERELFVWFFNQPERLAQQIAAIHSRITK
jgi:hypothetical protein